MTASLTSAGQAVNAMASSSKEGVELPHSNRRLFWDYDAEQAVAAIGTFLAVQMQDGDWSTGDGR